MTKKLRVLEREVEELLESSKGEITKDAININVDKVQELAPDMMAELYDRKFENCTVDVSIELGEIDITVLAEDKHHWANEDLYNFEEKELIALMEYIKEVI